MSNSLAVCRLAYKRQTIIESLPKISAFQLSIFLYSREVFDQVLRDEVIRSHKPAAVLYEQLVKICRTESSAFQHFIDALKRIDRHELASQIESTEVFNTLNTHLNFLGRQLLVLGSETRVDNFVDYIIDRTQELIVVEAPLRIDKTQFNPVSVGYNKIHYERERSGSGTPSIGYTNRIVDLEDTEANHNKRWDIHSHLDVAFLHGRATLMDGPAGIGKSTLCGQIACKFLKGDLPKFQNVVIIPCKKLNLLADSKVTFETLLKHCGYVADFDVSSPNFADQLIIFDGFEEFNRRRTFASDKAFNVTSSDFTEKTTDEWIRYLSCTNSISVVIVSRPSSLRFLNNITFKFRLRVMGFNDVAIRDYFELHNRSEQFDWLLQQRDYLSVYSQLYKPLNCTLYVRSFNHSTFNELELPGSSTELYKRIFLLQIEESCYVHHASDLTGIKDEITARILKEVLDAIMKNEVRTGKLRRISVSRDPEFDNALYFLETVCYVCYKMIALDCQEHEVSKPPTLRRSQIKPNEFEIVKRCGLFDHYDTSASHEKEDIFLPYHLRVVEFGASIYLIRKFYQHVTYAMKTAARNICKLFSGDLSSAMFPGVERDEISHEVIRFAVGLLSQSEGNLIHRNFNFFAKYHCNSMCRHLDDNTVFRLYVEVPDNSVWFCKLRSRAVSIVENFFSPLPPESNSTINSKTGAPLVLKVDNSDDKMQPSVLFSLVQILKNQAKEHKVVPEGVELCWIKQPWVLTSMFDIAEYCQNVSNLRLWGCRFIKKPKSLEFLSKLKNLSVLQVQMCGFRKLSEDYISEVISYVPRSIVKLDLSGNDITFTSAHFKALNEFTCLRSLLLYGNILKPYQIVNLLPSHLEELSLDKTGFDCNLDLDFSQRFPKLKVLKLSLNHLVPCLFLRKLPVTLETLDIQRNYLFSLTEENCMYFDLGYLINLEVLCLADIPFGKQFLTVPNVYLPPHLLDLDISRCGMNLNEVETELLLSKLPRTIQHLDLSGNSLTFGSKTCSLSKLSNLVEIDLNGTKNLFQSNIQNLINQLPHKSNLITLKLPEYCKKFKFVHKESDLSILYE